MRLLQVSGAVVDLLARVAAVPRAGEEAVVHAMATTAGGGFNAAAAARRCGMAVDYGGGLGTGPFAAVLRRALDAEGIAATGPRDHARDQGVCVVMTDDGGERTFVFREGAEGHLTPGALPRPDGHGWLLLSGYGLLYEGSRDELRRWLLALPPGAPLVFDPSPIAERLRAAERGAALARAAWVSANGPEARALTGEGDPARAALALAQGRAGAVVRVGADGCWVAAGGAAAHVPPFPVRAVDTNGAGDAHVGAFAAALARGLPPVAAARYANVAAAISATRAGPATAPGHDEVARAMEGGRP